MFGNGVNLDNFPALTQLTNDPIVHNTLLVLLNEALVHVHDDCPTVVLLGR